jgi:Pyruvate phosphate dikinase, AMP/ATP-binding domain
VGSTDIIGWFADIGLHDRPTVGGKGGSLGELTQAGIAVPAGYVVRTAAFERFIDVLESQSPIRTVVDALKNDDLQAITQASEKLRHRLESARYRTTYWPRSALLTPHFAQVMAMRRWRSDHPPPPKMPKMPVSLVCKTPTCG